MPKKSKTTSLPPEPRIITRSDYWRLLAEDLATKIGRRLRIELLREYVNATRDPAFGVREKLDLSIADVQLKMKNENIKVVDGRYGVRKAAA